VSAALLIVLSSQEATIYRISPVSSVPSFPEKP
jgi:hypothetical protein